MIPPANILTLKEVAKYRHYGPSSVNAENLHTRLTDSFNKAREAILKTQAYQIKYINEKRLAREFKIREKVWLNIKNITTSRPSKKLDYLRYSPYKILARIGQQAYRLDLLNEVRIYNIFHASLLKSHHFTPGKPDPKPLLLRIVKDLAMRE